MRRRYGWRPDLPDFRDRKWALGAPVAARPVDLRPGMPPIYDQGALGSCTANAAAAAIAYDRGRQKLPAFTPARLFIYWNERNDQGDTADDTGATIRECFKAINAYGACDETLWPYVEAQFATRPPAPCFAAALTDRVLVYESVAQSLDGLRAVLQAGLPIEFGFSVYESFESDAVAASGVVPLPAAGEAMLGGHAVLVVGDQPDQQRLIVRNSWGPAWGDQGYFYLPYGYALDPDLASDFWAAQTVSAPT